MEKIIEIALCSKEDLVEKYNNKIVSKNLIDYIMEQAMFIGKHDKAKVIINNQCHLNDSCLDMIKNGLKIEYEKNLRNGKLSNIKQVMLMIIGLIFLSLSMVIPDGFIFKEVFLIVGWVPIWEVIDIELFSDIKEKRKRMVLKKLLEASFEIRGDAK